MINLLPPQTAAYLRKEYRKRLILVGLVFLFILTLSSIVLIVPTLLAQNDNYATNKAALLEASARPVSKQADEIGDLVRGTNARLSISKSTSVGSPYSEIIDHIMADKASGISLSEVSMDNGASISIKGKAAARSPLLAFIKSLEEDTYFFDVKSPISNLINTSNIDFSIILSVGSSTKKNAKK